MTTRVKSALLLGVTLLIGVVLGSVLNAFLADRRLERFGMFRSEQGFVRHLEDVIEPTDDAQRQAIEAILTRTASRMRRHMDSAQAQGRLILDSTRAELSDILTPEQIERVDDLMRMRMERHGPGGGRGMGPGARRGPGRGMGPGGANHPPGFPPGD